MPPLLPTVRRFIGDGDAIGRRIDGGRGGGAAALATKLTVAPWARHIRPAVSVAVVPKVWAEV